MQSFPQAIKEFPQWTICGFKPGTSQEKQPYVWDNDKGECVPLRKDGNSHTPSNLHELMTFEEAYMCAQYHNKYGHKLYVGFYLLPTDPFCCIDMDMKEEWTPQQKTAAEERYKSIIATFHSYTEISKSGWGLHLWVYGDSVLGKRRDGVEIYSQYRFIICTGDHLSGTPLSMAGAKGSEEELYIASWLEKLRNEMGDLNGLEEFDMVELTEADWEADPYKKTCFQIYTQGCEAANGVIFKQLAEGRWEFHNVVISEGERAYQSASEAEYAFIDMLCFYTKYNFQVSEMFYSSPFGDRYFADRRKPGDKVKVAYHFNQMLLKRRRDEARDDYEKQRLVRENVKRMVAEQQRIQGVTTPAPAPVDFLATTGVYTSELGSGLEWPPGFVGELSRHMLSRSLRPIKDIAILTALSLMSGIAGKAWNTHTKGGLNNYFILVAPSGIGKDAYRSNMSDVMRQVSMFGGKDGTQLFGAERIVDTSRYASEQALAKQVIVQTTTAESDPGQGNGLLSFIHYTDEVGQFLSDIAMGRGKAPDLSHYMLSLYNESKFHSNAGALRYSNKDNNHSGGRVASYSFAGETTPDKFYNTVTQDMLSGGLMSRMVIWECDVLRPPENKYSQTSIPAELCQALGELVMQASVIHGATEPCYVQLDDETEIEYNKVDDETNTRLNGPDGKPELRERDESIRQLYNRRAFKILKIACLLAVGDNHIKPVVTKAHYAWAKAFIDESIARYIVKYRAGEIGSADDTQCELAVVNKCLRLLENKTGNEQKKYPELANNGVLTKNDIRMNTVKAAVFMKSKRGNVVAFDTALKAVVDACGLRYLSRADLENPLFCGGSTIFRGQAYLADYEKLLDIQRALTGDV